MLTFERCEDEVDLEEVCDEDKAVCEEGVDDCEGVEEGWLGVEDLEVWDEDLRVGKKGSTIGGKGLPDFAFFAADWEGEPEDDWVVAGIGVVWQDELVLVVIGKVDNVNDGLVIGMEESIQVKFVWHATLATERVAFVAAA